MSVPELLQFILAKGVGDSTIHRLANYVRREHASLFDVVNMKSDLMATQLNIKTQIAKNIIAAKEAAYELNYKLQSQNINIVSINDETYPKKLKAILGKDAPAVLFIRGNIGLLDKVSVSFCGSRKASKKGINVTEDCAKILTENQICVVSGYAHGVDMASHRVSLINGGSTIIVLVEGILRFKAKKEVRDLLTSENHLFVSQFPPNITWSGINAMKRNKTIIGLSDAMILVESGITGGTFAAGEETLRRNHPLFVVDFAKPGSSAEANPYFLSKGGIPIRGNRDSVPQLQTLLEVARKQKWKTNKNNQAILFDWMSKQGKDEQ